MLFFNRISLCTILIQNSFCQWKDPEAACGLRQGKWSKENAIPEVCVSIYSIYTVYRKDKLFALLILKYKHTVFMIVILPLNCFFVQEEQ